MLGPCDPLQQVSLLLTEEVKDTATSDDHHLTTSGSFPSVSILIEAPSDSYVVVITVVITAVVLPWLLFLWLLLP